MISKYIKNLLFLSFGCIGFISICCSRDRNQELSDESRVLYEFIARIGKDIGRKYRMSQVSVGGGVDKGIWLMSLDFQRYGSELTEMKARELIVSCLYDFMEKVNNDSELRPYLKFFPFTVDNVDMGIVNYTVQEKDIFHPYIRTISANKGEIGYFTKEKSDKYRYKSEKYETYNEAVAILKKEKEQSL